MTFKCGMDLNIGDNNTDLSMTLGYEQPSWGTFIKIKNILDGLNFDLSIGKKFNDGSKNHTISLIGNFSHRNERFYIDKIFLDYSCKYNREISYRLCSGIGLGQNRGYWLLSSSFQKNWFKFNANIVNA